MKKQRNSFRKFIGAVLVFTILSGMVPGWGLTTKAAHAEGNLPVMEVQTPANDEGGATEPGESGIEANTDGIVLLNQNEEGLTLKSYSIERISDQMLVRLNQGYPADPPPTKTITLTNNGTESLTNLTVAFAEGWNSRFTVTKAPATSLNSGESTTFDLKYIGNISAGIYVENVIVSAENMTAVKFRVIQPVDYPNMPVMPITGVLLTGMAAPAGGERPTEIYDLAVPGNVSSFFISNLTWKNADGAPPTLTDDGKFMEGLAYKAEIELTSAPINKFQTANQIVRVDNGISGAPTISGGDAPGNKLTFTVTFGDSGISEDWTEVGTGTFVNNGMTHPSLFMDGDTPYIAYTNVPPDPNYPSEPHPDYYAGMVKKFNGHSWVEVGGKKYTADKDEAVYTSLYVYDGIPYVSYVEQNPYNNTSVIRVKKYDAISDKWTHVGDEFNNETGRHTSLYVDEGVPYLAYTTVDIVNFVSITKVVVKKYEDGQWKELGIAGSDAVDGNAGVKLYVSEGVPYVSYAIYMDPTTNKVDLVVKKYENGENGEEGSWIELGRREIEGQEPERTKFTSPLQRPLSLYVDSGIKDVDDDTVYVAYTNANVNPITEHYKAVVMKYKDGVWGQLGGAVSDEDGLTPALYGYDGTLYVTYSGDYPLMLHVKKYEGGLWKPVGDGGVSEKIGTAAMSVHEGIPYVVYFYGNAQGSSGTVKKYQPTSLPTYAIAPIGSQTLEPLTAGYVNGTQQTKTITVTKTGTEALENLSASISGGADSSFIITQPLITTLNNGSTSTTFTVKAKNGLDVGTYNETVTISANNMTPVAFQVTQQVNAAVPGAPTGVSAATTGSGIATVTFTPPATNGGSPITGYVVTSSPGGITATGGASPITVTGLTDGTSYAFTVKAVNAIGNSAESTPSNVIIAGESDSDWVLVGRKGFAAGDARQLSLVVEHGTPYLTYVDAANGDRATVMSYDGENWATLGTAGFSDSSVGFPSLRVDNGVPYVAYQDATGYLYRATVMKYEGGNWKPLGNKGFSAGNASNTSLYIYDGVPYVAYKDGYHSGAVTVMLYDGDSWKPVGTPGFSGISSMFTSLYIDSGIPYVAFSDGSAGGKATVMKYNGSQWITVGNAGFSAGFAQYTSLYVDNGVPYVAYIDNGNSGKATVMRYNGNTWETVGNAGFSTSHISYPSLYMNDGVPYVGYIDSASGNKATVMKYNGSIWEPVGSAGLSHGTAGYTSLYIENGKIYVAYEDGTEYGKATVKRYRNYNIAAISSQTIPALTEGYGSGTQTSKSITVTNTGTENLTNLSVSLNSGANSVFEVVQLPDVTLNSGVATTLTVRAKDGLAVGTYTETVTVSANNLAPVTFTVTLVVNARPSTGGDGVITPAPTPEPQETGVEVLVNGKAENAGKATNTKEGDRTVTTIVVDEKKLAQKLESEGNKAVVTIPVNTKADAVIGELNAQMVKNMENKAVVLELRTENAIYNIPAQQINVDAVSEKIGKDVALQDIKMQVSIVKSSEETVKVLENSSKKGTFTIVAPPIDFSIKGSYGGKMVEVDKFNVFVERTVAIPDGVDPNKITTGIIVEPDGAVRHVPTRVTVINGRYYAKINSLTNSTYSVVWHPLEFKDAEGHWAKEAINDMGSRMVINGVGNDMFQPNRNITRAEFAAIVVKALGLKPGVGAESFKDVQDSDWYSGYVKTAFEYKIVAGYSADTFGPSDSITREQAMTMIAKAMKLTTLKAELSEGEMQQLLGAFKDGGKTAAYAKGSIAACIKTGIVLGKTGSMLAPKQNITRAEVAVIVRKLLQKADLI